MEASQLLERPHATSRTDAAAYARELARHVPNCAITLGEEGVVYAGAARAASIPARAVEVVDTTGADDAFAGALAVALVENQTLEAALAFVNAVAAFTTRKLGTTDAMPFRHELPDAPRA